LAYADDVAIVARSKTALTQAFFALEDAVNKMGLKVNQGKTSTCQYPQEEKDGKLQLFGL
jgi:hypothetical protein